MAESKNILMFGGNGFIGGETASLLIKSGYQLTLASRGHWDWDSKSRIRPFVRHIQCDRRQAPSGCPELLDLLSSPDTHFQAVIDFSAYRLRAVQPFYPLLKDKTNLYIYISSDSIYEVCKKQTGDGLISESSSVRPESDAERRRLNRKDSYGHRKLEVEEFLGDERRKEGVPLVVLRLPDVLGARDSTDRWWKYQLWMEFGACLQVPIAVPSFTSNLRTSFVSVSDVAAVIQRVLEAPLKVVQDKVYNVGFQQPRCLLELLQDMGEMGLGLDFQKACQEGLVQIGLDGCYFFPSIHCGALDVSKIGKDLNWESADWADSIRHIASFYSHAFFNFPQERNATLTDLLQDLEINQEDRRWKRVWDAVSARMALHEGSVLFSSPLVQAFEMH